MERLSLSSYQNRFILKGGMLVAAMVGLDSRSTMDMDATIKGISLSEDEVNKCVADIISIELDDGVSFHIKRISEIMDATEYPGIRISSESQFDGVSTPLKLDISTGDIITPKEIAYRFKLMFENR